MKNCHQSGCGANGGLLESGRDYLAGELDAESFARVNARKDAAPGAPLCGLGDTRSR